MTTKTVVLACMVDSVHVYRWLTQFDDTQVSFILFPSTPNRKIHPGIKSMIEDSDSSPRKVSVVPFGGKLSVPLWILDKFAGNRIRGFMLRRVLLSIKPDFLHALEFQNAGYISSRALDDSDIKTPFIVTNYGSDIYWFKQFKRHEMKIRKLLAQADMYSAECTRDYQLARELGFSGRELPVSPNAGGISQKSLPSNQTKCSDRKKIIIKGYHGWAGRALIALEAIELIADKLLEFEIIIYSANERVYWSAKRLEKRTGLKVRVFRKKKLTHIQMINLFLTSRIYIGLSTTDGISTSLLEAMATGVFPIQTATSCADEWIQEGVSGFIIESLDSSLISDKILQAISSDILVDIAQETNSLIIRDRAEIEISRNNANTFYFSF